MSTGQKLKGEHAPSKSQDDSAKSRVKRQKMWHARDIQSQTTHEALNERKELDIATFVKSRESEIRSLEASIVLSKTALATRAFQQVPRQLRRRTASHNVKKVPKRLRSRAIKDMIEDNTPTIVTRRREKTAKQRLRTSCAGGRKNNGTLAPLTNVEDTTADSSASFGHTAGASVLVRKFKKRQAKKSWLPTHVYHAKRAHMTPPLKPLWRFAIPLTPTEKSYRQTHRASTLRGCIAWDTSYMGSIQLVGLERSMIKLLRALSIPEGQLIGAFENKWLQGLRSWSGWVYERDNEQRAIAPVTILWSPPELDATTRTVLLRVHPSASRQLWQEVLKIAKMQRPAIAVHNLNFEIGSIQVTGPAASEALVQILRPSRLDSQTLKHWPYLSSVTNVGILPANLLVGLSITDPRLTPTPKISVASSLPGLDGRLEVFSHWPYDAEQRPFEILDAEIRNKSCKNILSQKAINKKRGTALPGEDIAASPPDPAIPLLLYTAQCEKEGTKSNSWVLLLPWPYVLPVWYCLMHISISSGSVPRFGGLQEQRQLAFETGTPWFPGDFPGTESGWAWELNEREQRKTDWEKRPKSKRVQWETINLGSSQRGEIGRGWACDWEYLYSLESHEDQSAQTQSPSKMTLSVASLPSSIRQGTSSSVISNTLEQAKNVIVAISLVFVNHGHAATCARIYRLPTSNPARAAWLAFATKNAGSSASNDADNDPVTTNGGCAHVPSAADLVGFVTTGNYNLREGKATAIGSVLLSRLREDPETRARASRLSGLCIVRDAGVSVGRLARWTVCS